MSNNNCRHKQVIYPALCLLVLFCMFTDVNISYAKQIQIVPIIPQLTSTEAKLSDIPVENPAVNKAISDLRESAEPSEIEKP